MLHWNCMISDIKEIHLTEQTRGKKPKSNKIKHIKRNEKKQHKKNSMRNEKWDEHFLFMFRFLRALFCVMKSNGNGAQKVLWITKLEPIQYGLYRVYSLFAHALSLNESRKWLVTTKCFFLEIPYTNVLLYDAVLQSIASIEWSFVSTCVKEKRICHKIMHTFFEHS